MSSISAAVRAEVVLRANNRCEYCHLPQQFQVGTFPIDHIVPRSDSGATESENLALACHQCNAHKWAFRESADPTTGRTVALYNPRTHDWSEHFRWSNVDSCLLEGSTEVGRATIELLRMNAPNIVDIRRLLADLRMPVT